MRADRIQITVSPEMTIALAIMAERSGLSVSTQAMVTLRQALDRTIGSAECQDRLARHRQFRTRDEWLAENKVERFVQNRLPRKEPAIARNGKADHVG